MAERVLGALTLLAAVGIGGAVGFVIGAITGSFELYRYEADARLARIRPVLQGPRFGGVGAEPSSDGHVYLYGRVATGRDRKALEDQMRSLFGDEEEKEMMRSVEAAEGGDQP